MITRWKFLRAAMGSLAADRLDRRRIGYRLEKDLPPVRREDCAAFASATRDRNPRYLDPDGPAPPLFLLKLVFPLLMEIITDRALGLNLLRTVHAGQEIVFFRPIPCGEPLRAAVQIRDISDTPAGELLELTGRCLTSGGEPVAEGTTGLMVRGRKHRGRKREPSAPEPKREFCLDIVTEDGQQREYARASGDTNFIHTSYLLSRLAGLPRTILHGSCLMAMGCASLTRKALGGDIRRIERIGGRFARPVLPGQKLTLFGYDPPGSRRIRFDIRNRAGRCVFRNGFFLHR